MNIIFFICGNLSGKNEHVHMEKSFGKIVNSSKLEPIVYSSKLELGPKCLDLVTRASSSGHKRHDTKASKGNTTPERNARAYLRDL